MKKAFYTIGANNATHKLEINKIKSILSTHFDGFTAFEVIGYWKGQEERALKAEIITELPDSELARIGKELKTKLEQESILFEIINSNSAFIQ